MARFRCFAVFGINLWSDPDRKHYFVQKTIFWFPGAFYVSALLALVAIVIYKKRKNQFVLNRLNMILNLFLLGFFVYPLTKFYPERFRSPRRGIGMLIPVISIRFVGPCQ